MTDAVFVFVFGSLRDVLFENPDSRSTSETIQGELLCTKSVYEYLNWNE